MHPETIPQACTRDILHSFGNKNSKRIRLAEFCHDLSAHTARIQIIVSISIDRNCCKLTLSLIDCLKKCCTLRTVCRRISCVFNIASDKPYRFFVRSAAPTRKWEYGTYACSFASIAAFINSSASILSNSCFSIFILFFPTNDILFTCFIVI